MIETKIKNIKFFQDKVSNSAQNRQDAIFRQMSADRKIKLGSQLWILAKELVGKKIMKSYKENYERNGSSTSIG